jgi:hypothetical protein
MGATAMTQKAYMVGVHRYAFRAGEPGVIIGTQFVKPNGKNYKGEPYSWRLAFIVLYDDGAKDFVSFEDVTNGDYTIISDVQLALGQIPEIVN